MEWLTAVISGFAVVADPVNLFTLFLGAVIGTIFGLLPGIGPSAGVALLLPVTFGMDVVPALIMLAGVYYGSQYGNSISAILINVPGTSSAAMTALDGYPMARKGRGGAALAIAAIASFTAGTIGIVLLSLFALPLANLALRFGPAEYFGLMIFALSTVSSLTGNSFSKGMLAVCFGLMIATVGTDLQTGVVRYTFGFMEVQDGIHLIVVIVGLFAVAEVFVSIDRWFSGGLAPIGISGRLWMTREEGRRSVMPILRGSVIGFIVGVLPGAGATIAAFFSYIAERKLSRRPEEFGKGAIEGVAGPEAANNGSTCGAFVPLLALGVPGSETTAVLLVAFIFFGIQPGPLLFQNHPDVVWGLIDSMYLGNVMLLILNLPLVAVFARILYMPPGILLALVMAIAVIGTYAVTGGAFDLQLMLAVGLLGYAFRKLDVPLPPLILAVVLAPKMEQSFRQAMTISGGELDIIFSSPIALTFVVLAIAIALVPIARVLLRRRSALPPKEDSGST